MKALIVLGTVIMGLASSLIVGTLVYYLWPIAIPGVFPGLVNSGTLAAELTWIQAVALALLSEALVKATTSSGK
jgi:hypothetical protein